MYKNILVSIVIPYYNGRDYIRETLESFIAQTYINWECLVVDDHSPECAEDICLSFDDSRIKYIYNDGTAGMANARNKGCHIAKGDFIALCDQDDLSLPNRLLEEVKVLVEDEALLLVGSWRRNFSGNTDEIHYASSPEVIQIRLLGNSQFTNPSIMFRRSLFFKHKLSFNQKMAPADDYDFICRVALLGKVTNIEEVLLLYRIHDKQVSTQNSQKIEKLAYYIRKKYMDSLLLDWVPFGLSTEIMADMFSKNLQNLNRKRFEILFSFWRELNVNYPLWKQRHWDAFLGEQCLMNMQHLDISYISKIFLIWKQKKIVFAFLNNDKFLSRIKFFIKSVI